MFKPLTKKDIYEIVELLIQDLNKRLQDSQVKIELTEAAKQFGWWMADMSDVRCKTT